MAFTSLTSAQCDADSPLDETLMQLIRTNLDDLDSRVNALAALSSQDIRDDFIQESTTIRADLWDVGTSGGAATPDIVSEHQMRQTIANVISDSTCVAADDNFIRIDISEEYVAVLEFRVKNAGVDAGDMLMGFQDVAMDESTLADSADSSDFIGIVRGGGSDWTIRTNTGGGVPTDRTGQGAQASWTKFKFTVTCSATAGNRKVEVDVDDVSSGTAITTTLPTTSLRPWFSCGTNGGAPGGVIDLRIDYVLAYFSGRPLAA